jgi:PEP-CTERM motif
MKHFLKKTGVLVSGVVIFILGVIKPVEAAPLPIGVWTEFSFTVAGTPATGCFPDDPAGNFCIPSSGTPSTFLAGPPWTFTSPVASLITVTDAFEAGDRFQLFDFGASIGLTSLPSGSADCGDDPVPCLAAAGISHGLFPLGAGAHSITITPTLSLGGGSAFLRVDAVPEPSSWILLGGGLAIMWLVRGKPQRMDQRRR